MIIELRISNNLSFNANCKILHKGAHTLMLSVCVSQIRPTKSYQILQYMV
mgnify:CR=1 FL=1